MFQELNNEGLFISAAVGRTVVTRHTTAGVCFGAISRQVAPRVLDAPLPPAAPEQHKQNVATPFPPALPTRMPPSPDAPPPAGQTNESARPFINEDIKAKKPTRPRGEAESGRGRRCLAAVSTPPLSSSGPNYPTSDVSLSSCHSLRLHSWPHAEPTGVTRCCAGVSAAAAALIKEGHWKERPPVSPPHLPTHL